MRLTLRTLLAWLDDTLQPTEVREIGKQVAESPYAQELSERIHRVARQRRLSVPSGSGPDGTDANLVASYLDNDLDPAAIPDFEKRCLTSDVNLAEVACVHQILSLLGQKVKVPDEAKSRMYQLVKGRESAARLAKRIRPSRPAEPLTSPIPTWQNSEPVSRGVLERVGPAAACVVLIGLASFSAWKSLTTTDAPPASPVAKLAVAGEPLVADLERPAENRDVTGEPDNATGASGVANGTEAATQASAEVAAASKAAEAVAAKKSEVSLEVPAGAAGITEPTNTILLLYNSEKREWERMTEKTKLNRSDRLLSLAPFRSTVTVGNQPVLLVGETEVNLLSKAGEEVPALELVHGRLLLSTAAAAKFGISTGSRSIALDLAGETTVSVEKWELPIDGKLPTGTPPFLIACIKGKVGLTLDKKDETLEAGSVAAIEASAELKRLQDSTLPPWAAISEPTPEESKAMTGFLRVFHAGRPVLADLVAATEDSDAAVKSLSVQALKATGEISLLLPMLSRSGDPAVRRDALTAIRAYLVRGGDAATRVREQLNEEFGDNMAGDVEKLLRADTANEQSNRDLISRLVGWLSPDQESVGIRELALDTLKRLTGRDDLGYDPDHPAGKGLDAWKQLLRAGELSKPATPRSSK